MPFNICNTMSIFEVRWFLSVDGMVCVGGRGVGGFLLQTVENMYDCFKKSFLSILGGLVQDPLWIPKSSDAPVLYVLGNQKNHVTHLIVLFTLLQWPGIEPTILPRYACVLTMCIVHRYT